MKNTIKRLKVFLVGMIAIQLIIWLAWSFVLMDAATPIIDTFTTQSGRGWYLVFWCTLSFCALPFLAPIEE